MKKILFLLLICFIKLNAYEYEVYNSGGTHIVFYTDNNGNVLKQRDLFVRDGSNVNQYNLNLNRQYLSRIRFNSQWGFIHNDVFDSYYKNDLLFLNDLYTSNNYNLISFLNYLYNNSEFSDANYINYDNYKILYNDDGLAVESLVDGVYSGLYNMDEMQFSGNLYNENGDLVLVNGFEPSFFQMLCDKLIGDLHLKMLDAENLIDKSWIFAVALTLAIFYLIARTLKRVLIGKNNKGVENES